MLLIYKLTNGLYFSSVLCILIGMDYVILDLEWNQCPDGKQSEDKQLPFEIVEIGAVKLDSKYREISRFSEIIRPCVYKSFHFKTQEIIQRNMDDFLVARTFPQVFSDFMAWCGNRVHFCTWGTLDLLELQRNVRYHQLPNPLRTPLRYYDIQKVFSLVHEDGKSRRTLEHAVDFLGLEKSMPFHDALCDAWYTAQVLKTLPERTVLHNYSYDYFRPPASKKEEIFATFDTYFKYVSREFDTKQDLMKDRQVLSTKCYLCHKAAKKKVRWFLAGNQNYFCLAYCEEHGWLRGKIRVKKSENGKYFCIKILKLVTPEDAQEIKERKDALKKKRSVHLAEIKKAAAQDH